MHLRVPIFFDTLWLSDKWIFRMRCLQLIMFSKAIKIIILESARFDQIN